MKLLKLGVTEKFKSEICVVNLTILFYLFRTAIPILKYSFIPLYISLFFYSFAIYKKRIIPSFVNLFRKYYLLLFLALILVISFILSNKLYLMIFKDVVNMVILISLFILLTILVSGEKEFKFYISNLVYLIILFAFVISILRLLNLFDIFSYYNIPQISKISRSSLGDDSSLIDSNFALLPIFFGIIGVFYYFRKTNSKFQKVFFNFLLVIFFLDIILSGSRRGLILLTGIFLILIIVEFEVLFKKNKFLKELCLNSGFALLSIIFLIVILPLFFFHTSYYFKTKTLETIGAKNILTARSNITSNIIRYVNVFDKTISYSDIHKKIWTLISDPKIPDSGWGSGIYRTVYPLTGTNSEIVPRDSKGYLLDSSCTAIPFGGKTYSSTEIWNNNLGNNVYLNASVYCYVSENFNGDWVNIYSIGTNLSKFQDEYDLTKKGTWQKLNLKVSSSVGKAIVFLYFSKEGVINFSSLRGYVIFAYPKCEILDKNDGDLSLINFYFRNFDIDSYRNDIKKYSNLKESYRYEEKGQKTLCPHFKNDTIDEEAIFETKTLMLSTNSQKIHVAGFNYIDLSLSTILILIDADHDPIRNLASKLISEDTTYHPYKANIVLDTVSNAFIGDRVSRWEFALKIFSQEYNWKQRIFGGGFNFLNWYGYYFDKDKTMSDYPHNPFLSILLYSGILGLIVYLIFMYKVFYYYVKYFKEYKILTVFFIITFFFSFFSAVSPFDPPIMGFFVILPFFIHSIHKKDLASKVIPNSTDE